MRSLTLVALALAACALLPASGRAHASGTAISISAQTSNKPLGQLIWATYGKTAQITGTVADGQGGTAVELQASVFPFSADFIAVAQTVTGDGGSYSFTAKPKLATRYRVILVSDPTSQSPVVTVYVAPHWIDVSRGRCGAGFSCRRHFAQDIVYPAAVARREAAKPVYFYFGVRYGSQRPPARVRLVNKGRQHHRSGYRYRTGFSVTFSTATAYYYELEICTRDTEARDGVGLPGHHHCGDRFIRYSDIQKGWIG